MRVKKILALTLALLLLQAVPALAAEEGNTLTVNATDSTEEAFIADIAAANVVVDLYKIADGSKNENYDTYDYTFMEGLTLAADPTAADWEALAAEAAALVSGDPAATGKAGEAIPGLEDGLYLVLAHGEDITDGSLTAKTPEWEYTFPAAIAALPTKTVAGADGSITTAQDSGAWQNAAEVNLKPKRTERYGDLVINKTVDGYDGQPVTFVFQVEGTYNGENVYSNVAAIQWPAASSATLTGIRAGAAVTVTEVYTGARYDAVTGPQDATIVADGEVSAAFANGRNDSGLYGGHGIENHFTNDGGWSVTQR